MEAFYKAFYLIRAFLKADAHVPPEVSLPDAEDRFVTRELGLRRDFPILQVLEVLQDMAQSDLLDDEPVTDVIPAASLSEAGLSEAPKPEDISELISLSPFALKPR